MLDHKSPKPSDLMVPHLAFDRLLLIVIHNNHKATIQNIHACQFLVNKNKSTPSFCLDTFIKSRSMDFYTTTAI